MSSSTGFNGWGSGVPSDQYKTALEGGGYMVRTNFQADGWLGVMTRFSNGSEGHEHHVTLFFGDYNWSDYGPTQRAAWAGAAKKADRDGYPVPK